MHRLYELAKQGELLFPAINVNDSVTKSKFDNLYGCRHSLIDGINRATDVMIGGKVAVVCGYGDVGKGCAESLRGQGARVDRHRDRPDLRAAGRDGGLPGRHARGRRRDADIFITATGNKDIITAEHMGRMKHQAIVGNIGHFDNEIDMAGLARIDGIERVNIKPQVDEWAFPDGHAIIVLSEGRLLNLGNATGHPSFVMSNSFTNQTIAQIELFTKNDEYEKQVYVLPKHLDEKVARLHLDALGVEADRAHARSRPPTSASRSRGRTSPTTTATSPGWRWPLRRRTSPTPRSPRRARPASSGPTRRCPSCARSASASRRERPLEGVTVAACLHVTAETANLVRALVAGGARGRAVRGQPAVHAGRRGRGAGRPRRRRGPRPPRRGRRRLRGARRRVRAATRPQVTLDDGADLVTLLHARPARAARAPARRHRGDDDRAAAPARAGGRGAAGLPRARRQRGARRARSSTTTTAPASRRSTASCAPPTCCWPARRSSCSATAGRAAASRCARAARARRWSSARSTRCARSRRGWRASRSCRRCEAAERGDVFVTVTGARDVLRREHFERMKDGAVLANAGHFDVEIDLDALRELRRRGAARCCRSSSSTTSATAA